MLNLVQATLIIVLTTLLLLLRRLLPVPQSNAPIWMRLLLVFEPAIEFPMIFAFHPMVMGHGAGIISRLPRIDELVLQVVVFFAIELAFQEYVLRYIVISPKLAPGDSYLGGSIKHSSLQDSHHEEAENLVLDFVRPRGTLLMTIALLGTSTELNKYTGQPHPIAMVCWTALEQLVNCRNLEVR